MAFGAWERDGQDELWEESYTEEWLWEKEMDKKSEELGQEELWDATIEREMDKMNFERKVTQRNGYERGCKKIMETC